MHRLITCLSLGLAAGLAGPADAQETASDKAKDLAVMSAKASADPQLQAQFSQIVNAARRNSTPPARDLILRQLFRNVGGRGYDLSQPLRIATIEALDPARSRAQVASQILSADLDGDWQITRDELTEALKFGMSDQAAQAFILGDADQNDTLTTDELKAAIETMARTRYRNPQPFGSVMPLFDFDDDGYLTEAEVGRGIAAVSD